MSKASTEAWRAARQKALRQLRRITPDEDAEIKAGIANDPDTLEVTDEHFKRMRPAAEVAPGIVAAYRRSRGPQKSPTKQLISIRLDRDLIEHFRGRGPGWQSEINDTLRKATRLHRKA
jgi:uncharacterized protein (DUF4415 family)